jgi:hypothetical protein
MFIGREICRRRTRIELCVLHTLYYSAQFLLIGYVRDLKFWAGGPQ